MIVAAGLTPAWQQIVELNRLEVGEVNRAKRVAWCASGKVLNVGLALHELGATAVTVSPAGGLTGQAMQAEFASHGAVCRWIAADAPTRVCTTLLAPDVKTGGLLAAQSLDATEIVENAAALTSTELTAFIAMFAEAAAEASLVVLTGSLPAGTPTTFYRDLLAEIRCPALLDIRGEELSHALPMKPFLVKPNRQELSATLGRPLDDEAAIIAGGRELVSRGATWVLISSGARGAWLIGERDAWRFRPPAITVVNPIGCGDCLAAGTAWGLFQELTVAESVRLGMAAAAHNAELWLPSLLDPARVHALVEQVAMERV
ncbi:MAG TPA: 1-phosphofructokinase family hexose kinase [Pirellulales bacterium]